MKHSTKGYEKLSKCLKYNPINIYFVQQPLAKHDFPTEYIESHIEESRILLVKDDEEKKPYLCSNCREIFTKESDY